MDFHFTPITEADALVILAWRYDPPYTTYNAMTAETAEPGGFDYLGEMLDTRSPYFAVRSISGEGWEREPPAGFFALGSACEVGSELDAPAGPHLYRPDGSITIGLGLRPDLTGGGLGLPNLDRRRWP